MSSSSSMSSPHASLWSAAATSLPSSRISPRAGARVTVLQRAERMLTRFEPELVGWLMEKFSEIGVEVRTGAAVEAIDRVGGGFRVRARAGSQEITTEADLVVHAAGRVPDLAAL